MEQRNCSREKTGKSKSSKICSRCIFNRNDESKGMGWHTCKCLVVFQYCLSLEWTIEHVMTLPIQSYNNKQHWKSTKINFNFSSKNQVMVTYSISCWEQNWSVLKLSPLSARGDSVSRSSILLTNSQRCPSTCKTDNCTPPILNANDEQCVYLNNKRVYWPPINLYTIIKLALFCN